MRLRKVQCCIGQATKLFVQSVLVSYFVEQFAWGLISPTKIQLVMSLAKQDLIAMANGTLNFSEVEALASIGAEGYASCNSL